jgi:transcription-repair coupling factor (superfamily II helicase)
MELETVLTRTEAKEAQPPVIDLGVPSSIPEEYVPDLPTRVGLYQRLVKLGKTEEVTGIETELLDRFGPLPWPVKNLLYTVRLRILAQGADVERVTKEDGRIVLRLRHDVVGARNVLQRLFGKRVEVGNTQLRMPLLDGGDGWEKGLAKVLDELGKFRERFAAELQPVR